MWTGRKLPPPQAPACQPLFLSYDIFVYIPTTPPDPTGASLVGRQNQPCFYFIAKVSLKPAQPLRGKCVQPFLNFLSLVLPSCVTGMSPDKPPEGQHDPQQEGLPGLAGEQGCRQLHTDFCSRCSPSFSE